jgi:beta-lactamase regulating signal transducer with metallopeptidase domain
MTTSDAVRWALSWLATYGLHSTLFLGGAWLLCRLRPPKVDRNRERLWKLALVGGVLSSTLQLALGTQSPLASFEWRPLVASRDLAPATETSPEFARAPRDARPSASAPAEPTDQTGTPSRAPALGGQRPARTERDAPVQRTTSPAADVVREARADVPRDEAPARPQAEKPLAGLAQLPGEEGIGRDAAALSAQLETQFGARLGNTDRTLGTRWPGLVLALWTTLGLAGVAGLLASWTCLRRRLLGRELLSEGPLHARFERLRERARVRTRVRLSVSPRIAAPFSTGLFRPEVCLPRAVLTDLTGAQQEALLAHELAHLVRHDPAWFGVGFLIEKLFFFQPLNRLARRQLSELAELACDDWAVRWTGARLALASCLTEVAGWVLGEKRRLLAPPGLAGQRSRLGQRVQRLLDDRRSPAGEPAAPWWPPLAAAALALVALAGPGVSAARARATRSEPPLGPSPVPMSVAPAATAEPERAPATVLATPRTASAQLGEQRDVLANELALLEAELAALHEELEAHALRTRFQQELAQIDARMQTLRLQHRRASELLAHFAAQPAASPANTPAPVPLPHTSAPDAHLSGDLR